MMELIRTCLLILALLSAAQSAPIGYFRTRIGRPLARSHLAAWSVELKIDIEPGKEIAEQLEIERVDEIGEILEQSSSNQILKTLLDGWPMLFDVLLTGNHGGAPPERPNRFKRTAKAISGFLRAGSKLASRVARGAMEGPPKLVAKIT